MGQQHDFSFGSLAWNAYYHGRNKDAKKAIIDKRERIRKAYARAETKTGQREFDQLREDESRTMACDAEVWGDLAIFDCWPETLKYCQCG